MKWLLDNNVFFPLVNCSHSEHAATIAWFAKNKTDGWGVTVETYLGCIRKLMNSKIMQGCPQNAKGAVTVARAALGAPHNGKIIIGGQPDDALMKKAQGHKQIMDFYLVQVARDTGMKLATRDTGILATFPAIAVYPS